MKTHILNRLLPIRLRAWLRDLAKRAIPSLRHLDMPMRMEHLRKLGFSPAVIYDIGCASGEWTRLAAKLWPKARIFGFEPNQSEHGNLERVRAEIANFQYFQAFLGPSAGTASYVNRGHQTSLLAGEQAPSAQVATTQAQVLVLDELIASSTIPPPDLLKLDVQGFELQVLKGGDRALAHAQMALLELNFYEFEPNCPLADEVIAFMKSKGMVIYDVMGILRRDSDDVLGHMDFMFIRPTHPLMHESSALSATNM